MRNLVEAHNRIKNFDWELSYAEKPVRYPTKYKIPKKTKDPFRHLLREYFAMEQEKDNRQYGALEDALARSCVASKAEPRWMEVMKIALPTVNVGEYGAMKAMGQLIDSIENAELRQGYMAQMLDETRHVHQQTYLLRYFARHANDPEAFARAMELRHTNPSYRAGRAAQETFYVGDPIEGALCLQVVGETAYTNPIFVAMTEVASANGDQVTPSVFLSIQSDEARHMANGYATLAAVVSEPDNLAYLQADFDRAFWRLHSFIDPFLNVVYDYFQFKRTLSYAEKRHEWIDEDWAGSYIAKLAPFGLKLPRWYEAAKQRMKWSGHTAAMAVFSNWPLHYYRFDPVTDADMEWFEKKYPGWYGRYGAFWREYRRLADPRSGDISMSLLPSAPMLCRVCQMPCVFPTYEDNECRVRLHKGRKHAFCSEACEFIFNEDPQRYLGYPTMYELYNGWDLADFIRHNKLLRVDGKTLLGQPWLDNEHMWTIDDIAERKITIKDPLDEVVL